MDQDQAVLDIQLLAIASIEACCASIREHLPATEGQLRELNEIYEQLLNVQRQVLVGDG